MIVLDWPMICVGAPIQRNRAWIIEEYLSRIYHLDYPKDRIHIMFFLNGKPQDNTHEYVYEFKTKFQHEYAHVDIWEMEDKHIDSRDKTRDFNHFADIRNTWLSMRRKEDQYILSVDSDILLPPETLKELLATEKPIVSALIENTNIGPYKTYNILDQSLSAEGERGQTVHFYEPLDKTTGIRKVDVTGACYLISREVLDNGAYYGYHLQGEDIFFCEQATKHGYEIYCQQDIQPKHIMEKGE